MSRLPQPSSRSGARSPLKTSSSPAPSPTPRATLTPLAKPRVRTKSAAPTPSPRSQTPLRSQPSLKTLRPPKSPTKSPARRATPLPAEEDVPPSPKPQLSIREQIALRRAEAKKAATKAPSIGFPDAPYAGLENASPDTFGQTPVVDVDLGRWSVKETIERGRSSGAINLSSRDLPCLPSALFEIHLGIKPEPLKSVPIEPPITTATATDTAATRRQGGQNAPSWYEAQDLEVLKAWSNEILELQPEISMFGSLKIIDLHNNKLTTLPDSFADLTALTTLDLSHNQLSTLPTNFWVLPHLTTLNLSHNALTALPFGAPLASEGANPLGRTRDARGDWFSQSITRATEPLPRLTVLEASHNQLSALSVEHSANGPGLPAQLTRLDLSENPLGRSESLLRALGRLARLKEIRMQRADIGDESFPVTLFAASSGPLFPALKVFDLEETYVSRPVIEAAFTVALLKQALEFDSTAQEPAEGVLRLIVGKRVIKEAWEIEAERRTKLRRAAAGPVDTWSLSPAKPDTKPATKPVVAKESWEVAADQGLLSEGAKRRARAMAAAAAQSSSASSDVATSSSVPKGPSHLPKKPVVVEKEQWEIEAEQGLLSAGARRRARAAAVAAIAESTAVAKSPPPADAPSPAHNPTTVASALASPQYYSASAQTLTLPPSAPPTKAAHSRSFSLAAPAWNKGPRNGVSELALAIPAPTLPLAAIAAQPLAQTLKVLVLTGRRSDPSFSLPSAVEAGLSLPWLEELTLDNCNLSDMVPVSREGSSGSGDDFTQRTSEPLLPLLARLFPSVRTLDLSYNALTSEAFTEEALSTLIFSDTPAPSAEDDDDDASRAVVKKGLRHLRLRGNRLGELDGFRQLAERFKGNRLVPEWKLEELDLRDNEIGKLPPELGMLPLDVFLVDGNTFRMPARRVWEREGTKGLLSWLRGRME